MSASAFFRIVGCLVSVLFTGAALEAALRLPAVFSDHMVVQAAADAPCWGWANPGAEVRIEYSDTENPTPVSAQAVADASGKWKALLPAIPAGSRGTLTIKSGGEARVIANVVAGEVWLASGQSNMTYRVGAPDFPAHVAELARKEATNLGGEVRIFTVIQEGADEPRGDVRGKWVVVDAEAVGKLSAVPWNFAHALHRDLGRPVGVIVSGHGGTPVESWLSKEALAASASAEAVWTRHAELLARFPKEKANYDVALAEWERANPTEESRKKNQAAKPRAPYSAESSKAPVRLFNAMIDGLVPYAIRGVVWYQGEENSGRSQEYPALIRALVASWRAAWGLEWPFYYVELANTRTTQTKPSEGGWALIREAQASVLALPGTGVVTAVDLGDGTIHPWKKKEVGERLAALALADAYGRNGLETRSPEFAACEIVGDTVTIRVRHAQALRMRGDGVARGFAIRGEDGIWHWGDARVEGDKIVVRGGNVPAPVAVRYGWASNPVLSVESEAGLPLRPFRTDRDLP